MGASECRITERGSAAWWYCAEHGVWFRDESAQPQRCPVDAERAAHAETRERLREARAAAEADRHYRREAEAQRDTVTRLWNAALSEAARLRALISRTIRADSLAPLADEAEADRLQEAGAERPATEAARTCERLREALATIADRGCASGNDDACAAKEPSRRCDACLAEAALVDEEPLAVRPGVVPGEGADDGGCGWGNAD